MTPNKPGSTRTYCWGGFTLLEILVVLIIISIMSALMAPRFVTSLSNLQLNTASKKVAGALRYARSRAVSERMAYLALFDFEKNYLSVEAERVLTSEDQEDSEDEAEEAAVRPKIYALPETVEWEKATVGESERDEGTFQITFYPNGGSSGGEVVLRNERGRRYEVEVDFVTGTVRIGKLMKS